jgi:hypothetical protein
MERYSTMTPGQLAKAVSVALDVSEETVVQHDRNLVVAGLRTKGGRGRSAPKVTYQDAARLLTATLGSVRTKDSVSTVKAFERTRFVPPTSFAERLAETRARGITKPGLELTPDDERKFSERKFSDTAIMSLPKDHNFVEGLTALIRDARWPEQADQIDNHLRRFAEMRISCCAPFIDASITDRGGTAGYMAIEAPRSEAQQRAYAKRSRERRDEEGYKMYLGSTGIYQMRHVYGIALIILGISFYKDEVPASIEAAIQTASAKKAAA